MRVNEGTVWKRLLSLLLSIVIYYSIDWLFYRIFLAKEVSFIITEFFNIDTTAKENEICLNAYHKIMVVEPRCTHILLCFVIIVFFYNFKKPLASILYLGGFLLIVQLMNFLRITYAGVMWAKGYSWFWNHDVVNVAFIIIMLGGGWLISKYLLAASNIKQIT